MCGGSLVWPQRQACAHKGIRATLNLPPNRLARAFAPAERRGGACTLCVRQIRLARCPPVSGVLRWCARSEHRPVGRSADAPRL